MRERLAHRLIYYYWESEGRAPPALHRDSRHDLRRSKLYAITEEDALEWIGEC